MDYPYHMDIITEGDHHDFIPIATPTVPWDDTNDPSQIARTSLLEDAKIRRKA